MSSTKKSRRGSCRQVYFEELSVAEIKKERRRTSFHTRSRSVNTLDKIIPEEQTMMTPYRLFLQEQGELTTLVEASKPVNKQKRKKKKSGHRTNKLRFTDEPRSRSTSHLNANNVYGQDKKAKKDVVKNFEKFSDKDKRKVSKEWMKKEKKHKKKVMEANVAQQFYRILEANGGLADHWNVPIEQKPLYLIVPPYKTSPMDLE
eukprot:TRINITY_DN9948_c0_g1_i1.p1 TRINITY_DN9948_c0_g1~~TRINITY_DN9948_c0_g1_i1.p1  ORF type:complete len:203 (-),score=32.00 TRINITY_DN9948_c0_g1_i1:36-644(-)